VLGRDATLAEFQAAFPSMPVATVYLNSNATGSCSNGCFPQINGGETFELWNGTTKVDGTTIAMSANNVYQRNHPGDPAGTAGSWTTVTMANANPGQGAGTGTGVGVVINEMADASAWADEFIELYYDAGAAQADTTPPRPWRTSAPWRSPTPRSGSLGRRPATTVPPAPPRPMT